MRDDVLLAMKRKSTGVPGMTVLVGQAALLISVYVLFGLGRSAAHAATDLAVLLVAWAVSVFITCKHRPKFYQRRFTYIAAPFLKAAVIMVVLVYCFQSIFNFSQAQSKALLVSTVLYSLIELLILAAWCSRLQAQGDESGDVFKELFSNQKHAQADLPLDNEAFTVPSLDLKALLEKNQVEQAGELFQFMEESLRLHNGCRGTAVVHSPGDPGPRAENVGLILGPMSLNTMRSINGYLSECYRGLLNGGWLVVKYTDVEEAMQQWKRKFGSFFWTILSMSITFFFTVPCQRSQG